MQTLYMYVHVYPLYICALHQIMLECYSYTITYHSLSPALTDYLLLVPINHQYACVLSITGSQPPCNLTYFHRLAAPLHPHLLPQACSPPASSLPQAHSPTGSQPPASSLTSTGSQPPCILTYFHKLTAPPASSLTSTGSQPPCILTYFHRLTAPLHPHLLPQACSPPATSLTSTGLQPPCNLTYFHRLAAPLQPHLLPQACSCAAVPSVALQTVPPRCSQT